MAQSIHFRSFLIGGFVASLILCVLGAAPRLLPMSPTGPFTLVASHGSNGEMYLLDTRTGQVWAQHTNHGTREFYAPKLKVPAPVEPNSPDPR